jgi:hypothetical protein
MASKKPSIPINSPATLDKSHPRRLVTVYFHTDRYKGKCKLLPIKPAPNRPQEYESEEIVPGADKDMWGAAFVEEHIPAGVYILEVPVQVRGGTHPVRHLVRLDHAYQNVIEVPEKGKVTEKECHEPILHEPLIGDSYSLEEACLGLFGYKYADGLALLLKEATSEGGGDGGGDKKSAFATALGVTEALHDRIEAALGIVKLENKYFKNFAKIWHQAKTKPKSWKTFESRAKSLSGEAGEKGFERQLKSWGLLEWKEHMEGSAGIKGIERGSDVLDKILSTYHASEEVGGFLEAFAKAHESDLAMLEGFSGKYHAAAELVPEQFESWFSRGDLSMLEGLCQEADNRAGEAQVEGAGFTSTAVAAGMGLFFPEGFLECVLGKSFAKAVDVLGLVKTGLVAFDGFLFQNEITNRCRDITEWWHDTGAAAHNNSWIFYLLVGRSTSNWNQAEYGLALLYRAKVLYGLMDLINQCGPALELQFENNVKELRIQEYIDKFVLGPGFWVRNDHLNFDWVQHFHLEKEKEIRDQVVRFEAPQEDGSKRGGWNRWGPLGWTKVDFQQWFPIHFMDHRDAAAFAKDFSTKFRGISRSDVATTFWQTADSVETTQAEGAEGETQVNLNVTSWRTLKENDVVDSEMPVRAVLVLKSAFSVGTGAPATFQPVRVDWLNVDGPVYPAVIRRLGRKDLLPPSVTDAKTGRLVEGLDRRLGAIVVFDYYYTWKNKAPSKLFWGLKPLTGTCHDTWPQKMSMSAKWTIGHNEAHDWLANGQEIYLVPFNSPRSGGNHVGLYEKDFDVRNWDKFRDRDFLKRSTRSEDFTADVDKSAVTVTIQAKNSDGWCSLYDSSSTVISYGQPVRVVLCVTKKPHYGTGIPAAVRLLRTDQSLFFNVMGPIYRSEKMYDLDPVGFPGKWGTVIDIDWFLLLHGDDGTDTATKIEGIKPLHQGDMRHTKPPPTILRWSGPDQNARAQGVESPPFLWAPLPLQNRWHPATIIVQTANFAALKLRLLEQVKIRMSERKSIYKKHRFCNSWSGDLTLCA